MFKTQYCKYSTLNYVFQRALGRAFASAELAVRAYKDLRTRKIEHLFMQKLFATRMNQDVGETTNAYIIAVIKLAETFNFGALKDTYGIDW